MLSFCVCGSSYLRHFTRQRYKSIIFSKLIIFSSSYRNRIVFDINEEKIWTTDKTNDIPHVYKSLNLDFFNRLLPALFVSVVFLHFVQIIFHIVHVLLDWSLNLIIKYFIIYQELPVVNTFVNHRFSGLQLLLTLLHLSTKKIWYAKLSQKFALQGLSLTKTLWPCIDDWRFVNLNDAPHVWSHYTSIAILPPKY